LGARIFATFTGLRVFHPLNSFCRNLLAALSEPFNRVSSTSSPSKWSPHKLRSLCVLLLFTPDTTESHRIKVIPPPKKFHVSRLAAPTCLAEVREAEASRKSPVSAFQVVARNLFPIVSKPFNRVIQDQLSAGFDSTPTRFSPPPPVMRLRIRVHLRSLTKAGPWFKLSFLPKNPTLSNLIKAYPLKDENPLQRVESSIENGLCALCASVAVPSPLEEQTHLSCPGGTKRRACRNSAGSHSQRINNNLFIARRSK